MLRILVELRKMVKELLARLESQNLKKKKAKGFNMQVGSWVIPKQWNFKYSSLITGGYVIKRITM